jgi:hypothetical protein
VWLTWGFLETTFSKPHAALWRCRIYFSRIQPSSALNHLLYHTIFCVACGKSFYGVLFD